MSTIRNSCIPPFLHAPRRSRGSCRPILTEADFAWGQSALRMPANLPPGRSSDQCE
jgi:hypothetical protein